MPLLARTLPALLAMAAASLFSIGWMAHAQTNAEPAESPAEGLVASPTENTDTQTAYLQPSFEGVAVVELFTSQGCSSCPPADELLGAIDDLAKTRSLPIYALSMHVDYWDSLGWADPYAKQQFSERQRRYAYAANSNRVYTPQMIVNGTGGFTGSNRTAARLAIREAIDAKPTATVVLDVAPQTDKSWQVRYAVAGAQRSDELVVCLVADAPATFVPRGENRGEQLAHVGVVRTLRREPLSDSVGEVTLDWPANQSPGEAPTSIVAFVQNRQTLSISGASRWVE